MSAPAKVDAPPPPLDAVDPEALIAEARAHRRARRRRVSIWAAIVLVAATGAAIWLARSGESAHSPARAGPAAAPRVADPPAELTATGLRAAAVAKVGNRVVAAGIGWYGAYTGSGLLVSGAASRATPAMFDGQISDAAPDGHGGVFVGGDFRRVGPVRQPFLVHLRADGTVDRGFRPHPGGFVDTVRVAGGRVYAGGRGVVAFSARSGRRLRRYAGSQRGVAELAVGGGVLYVGAPSRTVAGAAGAASRDVAAIDLRSGRRLAGFRPGAAGDRGGVSALRLAGGRLWVGLRGRSPRDRTLLRLDPRTGHGSAVPRVRGGVDEVLALGTGRLLVTGSVRAAGRRGSRGALVIDPATLRVDKRFACALPGAGGDGLAVYDAARRGGVLWLGGRQRLDAFTGGGLSGLLAAVDPATCAPRPGAQPPQPNGPVNALAALRGSALAGGQLWVAHPRPALDAVFDAATGRVLGPAAGLPAGTRALLADGRLLWAASWRELRAVDPATGAVRLRVRLTLRRSGRPPGECRRPIGDGPPVCRPAAPCGPVGTAHARCAAGPTTLFGATSEGRSGTGIRLARAGGRILVLRSDYPAGFGGPRIEAFDASRGRATGFTMPYPSAGHDRRKVTDMLGVGGAVYLAGSFLRARPDGTAANLAIVKTDAGGTPDERFDAHVDGPVQSLATDGSRLFVDGLYSRPRTGLVAVDPATGRRDATWSAGFPPAPAPRLALNGTRLERVGRTLLLEPRPGSSRVRALRTDSGALRPLTAGGVTIATGVQSAPGRWFVAGTRARASTIGSPRAIAVAGVVREP